MLLWIAQCTVAALLIGYAASWCRLQLKRRRRNWYEIVSQLQGNDWGIEEVTENYLYKGAVLATPQDIWQRIAGCHGLIAMYKNSSVLVELADYAAEHSSGIDQKMLEDLRSDAFQIRLCVMRALTQHMMSSSTAGASLHAHRATTTYSEMLVRLTALIQEHSAGLFPSYLDAVA